MSDTKPTLMGRYKGPRMTKTDHRGIKLTAQPAPGEAYPVIDTALNDTMVCLSIAKASNRWVMTEQVQQFWLLPDGTELPATE